MAGSAGSKYRDVFLKYAIRLTDNNDKTILPDEFFVLLKLINTEGSIVAASGMHNISFRKAWNLIKKAEKQLGFKLVIPVRGGLSGGHTELSPEGIQLLQAYTELMQAFDVSVHDITRKFFKTINTI